MKLFKFLCFFTLTLFICLNLLVTITKSFDNNYSINWTNQTSLPIEIASSQVVTMGEKLIVVGGSSGTVSDLVFSSTFDLNGDIGSWSSFPSMPKPLLWHSVLKYGDFIYIFGGATYPNSQINTKNDVYKGYFNSNGSITNWETLTPLPDSLAKGSVVLVGDRVYYSGGGRWIGGGSPYITDKIYTAKISDLDNKVSDAWSIAATLPTPLMAHSMVYTGKRLVIIGGVNYEYDTATNKVYSYSVQNNGVLSDYKELPPLKFNASSAIVQQYDGNIFLIGGTDKRGVYLWYYYSLITEDGDTSDWEFGGNTPDVICCTGSVIWNDKIYIAGGYGTGYVNTVWRGDFGGLAPTPTVTPTPIPTISPEEKFPIVILPGIGASFNHEALMKGTKVPNEKWEIASFVDVYDGLIESLEFAGYQKEKDLFVYAYDWRRPIEDNSRDLEKFVKRNVLKGNSIKKVNVIGHSMGGLVARRYAQISNNEYLNKLVIVGSPQKGAVKTYKVWEGADFSDFPLWQSGLIRMYLTTQDKINKPYLQKVRQLVPSLQELLPTFNYLKDSSENYILTNSLRWQNHFLYLMSHTSDSILRNQWRTVIGDNLSTLGSIKVESRSNLDELLNLWEDGKPISGGYENINAGDGTVLVKSATLEDVAQLIIPSTEHSELITKASSQSTILGLLGISAPGKSVNGNHYNKAIIVAAGSPIDFQVKYGNTTIDAKSGIVYIDEPPDGDYQIIIKPIGSGKFSLYIGRLDNEQGKESWETIDSNTKYFDRGYSFTFKYSEPDLGANYIHKIVSELNTLLIEVLSSNRTTAEKMNLKSRISSIIGSVQKWSREKTDNLKYYENKAELLIKSLDSLTLKSEELIHVGIIKDYLGSGYRNRN